MRYRLRTLLIVLAVGPPLVAGARPHIIDWLDPPPPRIIVIIDGRDARCMEAWIEANRGEPEAKMAEQP